MFRSLFWLTLVTACAPTGAPPTAAPTGEPPAAACRVVTVHDDLVGCVGKIVTVRGIVTRTKQPTILGVDVDAAYELSDQPGEATGTLQTYTIAPRGPDQPIVASRRPGTYYALRDGEHLAMARAVPAPDRKR